MAVDPVSVDQYVTQLRLLQTDTQVHPKLDAVHWCEWRKIANHQGNHHVHGDQQKKMHGIE